MKRIDFINLRMFTVVFICCFLLFLGKQSQAAVFTVDTTDDTVDANPGDGTAADADGNCSLRAAIMESNELTGGDTIKVPAGVYKLMINGTEEDQCATGDLDILSSLTIQGAGKDLTIIDGNQLDRVFHIKGLFNVTLTRLTVTGGLTPAGQNVTSPGSAIISNVLITGKEDKLGDTRRNRGVKQLLLTVGVDKAYPGGSGDGAGLYSTGYCSLKMSYCTVSKNKCGDSRALRSSGGNGGGICITSASSLTLNHCSIVGNKAGNCYLSYYAGESFGGSGGGIDSTSTVYVYNSLISQNSAGSGNFGGSGAGISNYGDLILANSTITGNYIEKLHDVSDGGSGIHNGGKTLIDSCTITNNLLDGICNSYPYDHLILPDDKMEIQNSIIALNGDPKDRIDCAGEIDSLGYNLIKDVSPWGTIKGDETGNIYEEDPKLEALADNGGPTLTQALRSGSPAVDAGDPEEYNDTDQRGVFRPKDGDNDGTALPDIGAFEKFTPHITITFPAAGDKVCGTIEINAEANTGRVGFYIDDTLIETDYSTPFSCTWDTTSFSNGSHKVKAKGYDSTDGFYVEDEVNVSVSNTLIRLETSRHEENAWLIKRQYGKISFTIKYIGSTSPVKYIIERKDADGTFAAIKEVPAAEIHGNSYTYYDPLPDKEMIYTYRVTAVDGTGMMVGQSDEKTI